jgi:mannosyltransferase OCH1-like enzyme
VNTQIELPKTLWLYWHQGWDNAPSIVKRCLRSWEEKNRTWMIHKLDASTVRDFVHLPDILLNEPDLPLCVLADLIRINLLCDYGGVWADATVYCQRPLDDWISRAANTGFFAFERPVPTRPLSNWFIASAARHGIIEEWRKRANSLWLEEGYLEKSRAFWSNWTYKSCPEHYFWPHHLFQKMIEEDQAASQLWAKVLKVNASWPHVIQHRMLQPLTTDVKEFIDGGMMPVHKLTYRYDENQMPVNSCLEYLFTK